ncbi:MAG: hypothetical protein ACI4P0_06390 [Mailhella sp.]
MAIELIAHTGRLNADVPLDFSEAPRITPQMYQDRISTLLDAGREFTHLVIYADREHFSNLEYVTGYDPRFEECFLILQKGKTPVLVLGNEGMGQSLCITIPVERVLCQMLSPLGQARGQSQSPEGIFRSMGMDESSHIGLLGWKSFCAKESPAWEHTFEVPSFLVDALRAVCPDVRNANGLMMDNQTGLRMTHSAEELILSELASTKASRKTWDFICALRPGQTELEASQAFNIDGEPCPTHPNICFKGRGILSPDPWTTLEYGKDIAFGMGYRCAQIHRVGVYVRDREEFEKYFPGAYEGLYKKYFQAVCAWYESLAIGTTGGEVWQKVRDVIGCSYAEFGIGLNPGHIIHTEEWTNSPFSEGDETILRSGMMIQCDFTARQSYYSNLGVHIEDGVILADKVMQDSIYNKAPLCMKRMLERQRFMRETLGIRLRDEVLPTSDLAGLLFPFLAKTDCVFAQRV